MAKVATKGSLSHPRRRGSWVQVRDPGREELSPVPREEVFGVKVLRRSPAELVTMLSGKAGSRP